MLFWLHLSEHVLRVKPYGMMDVKLLSALTHCESLSHLSPCRNFQPQLLLVSTLLADREDLKISVQASVHNVQNLLHLPTGDRFRAGANLICTQACFQVSMASQELRAFLSSIDNRYVDHADAIHKGEFTNQAELAAADRTDLEKLGIPKGAAGLIIAAAGGKGDLHADILCFLIFRQVLLPIDADCQHALSDLALTGTAVLNCLKSQQNFEHHVLFCHRRLLLLIMLCVGPFACSQDVPTPTTS